MKKFTDLVSQYLPAIVEVFPWDLEKEIESESESILLVDIREPYEYDAMRLENSVNIPRGILEIACEWGYEETVPELACAREKPVVLLCRSGNRTILAAKTLTEMGYKQVRSLKTGLRGWNDYELPLFNAAGRVTLDDADEYFFPNVSPEQLGNALD